MMPTCDSNTEGTQLWIALCTPVLQSQVQAAGRRAEHETVALGKVAHRLQKHSADIPSSTGSLCHVLVAAGLHFTYG
jgi:hypothetical protein